MFFLQFAVLFSKTMKDLLDYFSCRGAFNQRHVDYDATGILNSIAPDNFRDAPICAFDEHIGNNGINDALWSGVIENKNKVDTRQSRQHLGSLRFGHNRARRSLNFPDRTVAVDSDHQYISQRTRLIQISDMADVQDVKAAIREDDLFPKLAKPGSRSDDFVQGFDLLKRHSKVRG